MSSFLHDDLLDPGANWCPLCGEMRGVCQCSDDDIDEAYDDDYVSEWYDADYFPCMCEYCQCGNTVLGGGICNNCFHGEHQG